MTMTEEQIAEIKAEMVPSKDAAIVRFQVNGNVREGLPRNWV